jgi:coenzyme F420-reducing hydrogenase beta subunit
MNKFIKIGNRVIDIESVCYFDHADGELAVYLKGGNGWVKFKDGDMKLYDMMCKELM